MHRLLLLFLLSFQSAYSQVDQSWKNESPDIDGGTFVLGLLLFAIIGAFIAKIRRSSEESALILIVCAVIALSIFSGLKSGPIGLLSGAIGGTFLGIFIWIISGFFPEKEIHASKQHQDVPAEDHDLTLELPQNQSDLNVYVLPNRGGLNTRRIVFGYQQLPELQPLTLPDEVIMEIYMCVGHQFSEVAAIRGELLSREIINRIVFFFIKKHQLFGETIVFSHLDYEVDCYQKHGLREEYKNPLFLPELKA